MDNNPYKTVQRGFHLQKMAFQVSRSFAVHWHIGIYSLVKGVNPFLKCVTPDCHSKYFLYVGLTSYLMSSIHADLSHPFFQKILRAHGMCARCYKKEAPFLWPVKSIRTYCLLFTSAFNQYLTLADSRPKFSASNLIMLINMLWKLKGLIF